MSVEVLLLLVGASIVLSLVATGIVARTDRSRRAARPHRTGTGVDALVSGGAPHVQSRQDAPLEPSEANAPRAISALPGSRRLVLPDLRRKPLSAPAIVLRRPSRTRHPIVLAHGYLGFRSIGVQRVRREYFVGVQERLEALGHSVYPVSVAPAGAIALRAAQLAGQIETLQTERVNIIAHSMGGLDARYAITRLGLEHRVASLTTIGTPHRGTPLADTGALLIGEWRNVRNMLDAFGANVDGLYDLTTTRMAEFNRAVPDVNGVYYSSVVGALGAGSRQTNAILAAGHAYLLKTIGSNDGIVPAESQKWGDVLGEVEADHWAQIGWSGSFDARAFYALLVEHLAEWGL